MMIAQTRLTIDAAIATIVTPGNALITSPAQITAAKSLSKDH